jgi:RimJ/RimL family protein N-acetyltransferase
VSHSFAPLSTDRLLLRMPCEADLAAIYALYTDPAVNRFNPSGVMHSRTQAQVLLKTWLAHWQQAGFGYWAIALREQPEALLGFGGLMSLAIDEQPCLNLYFRFYSHAWGCGYASEMALAALEQAFTQWHARAVLAVVEPANVPSRKTLERIGMRLKGAWADRPAQPPSLLYEMSAAHWAELPQQKPQITPFGA